jgi:hypothetical protein
MKIRERYQVNKDASVGDECLCPSCDTRFIKDNYQQAFCKTKRKTKCKDGYWNKVTPNKRNNKTRISPASARWLKDKREELKTTYHIQVDGGINQETAKLAIESGANILVAGSYVFNHSLYVQAVEELRS